MKFKYKAKTKRGKLKQGAVYAANRQEARLQLLEKDLILLSVEPLKAKPVTSFLKAVPSIGSVSGLDKMLFAKHLAIMIKAGLTIREGVETILDQAKSPKFKKALKEIIKHLDNGEPLGKALARYPHIFSELFINMIKIGEASGTLEENLNHLAEHLEKENELRKKIIAASIYPVLILAATSALSIFLALYIMPKLIPLFESFNVELPLPTVILLFIVKSIQNQGVLVLSGLVALIVFIIFIGRLKPVKLYYHQLFIKVPILGPVARNTNLAQFTRTLGTLLKSGISVVEAIEITSKTTRNLIYRQALEKTSANVKKGKPISFFFKSKEYLFPATVTRMVGVGEKSGHLEETLVYLAEFYEKEVDNTTKNLSSILEPVLLIFIGFIVAFVAISVILPIYNITRGLRVN